MYSVFANKPYNGAVYKWRHALEEGEGGRGVADHDKLYTVFGENRTKPWPGGRGSKNPKITMTSFVDSPNVVQGGGEVFLKTKNLIT